MKQKHQLIALPTDNPIFPCACIGTPELGWRYTDTPFGMKETKYYHPYLLSDEEIKEGDWFIYDNELHQCDSDMIIGKNNPNSALHFSKKIIATTNPDLWYDRIPNPPCLIIPKLPQSLIEDFVKKQGKVDSVMVEYEEDYDLQYYQTGLGFESAKRIDKPAKIKLTSSGEIIWSPVEERTYTRDELREAVRKFGNHTWANISDEKEQEWFDKNYPQ